MWETLDLCLNVVDSESLDQLVPRLAQLFRSGLSLSTRYVLIVLLLQIQILWKYFSNLLFFIFCLAHLKFGRLKYYILL